MAEPSSCSYWGLHALQLVLSDKRCYRNKNAEHCHWRVAPRSSQLEKSPGSNEHPAQANKEINRNQNGGSVGSWDSGKG